MIERVLNICLSTIILSVLTLTSFLFFTSNSIHYLIHRHIHPFHPEAVEHFFIKSGSTADTPIFTNLNRPSSRSFIPATGDHINKDVTKLKQEAWYRYQPMLDRITNYCEYKRVTESQADFVQKINTDPSYWKDNLMFASSKSDPHSHAVYCQVAGASSSFWISLMDSTNLGMKSNPRDLLKPATQHNDFIFSMVKHPFKRLASEYFNVINSKWTQVETVQVMTYSKIRTNVISWIKKRNIDKSFPNQTSPSTTFTPIEFVTYILEEVLKFGTDNYEKRVVVADDIFKPQWMLCPFCAVDFDGILKVENFDEDVPFMLQILEKYFNSSKNSERNAEDQRPSELKYDVSGRFEDQDQYFFSKLRHSDVVKLHAVYRTDFFMFGYVDFNNYLMMASKD